MLKTQIPRTCGIGAMWVLERRHRPRQDRHRRFHQQSCGHNVLHSSRLARGHIIQPGGPTVASKLKNGSITATLICLSSLPMAQNASAISAEVAKKCGALTDRAYPLRMPGNPAAGRTRGTAQDVQDYFNKCVANGGDVPGQVPEKENHQDTQAPKTR
jgi:hypothetical protein